MSFGFSAGDFIAVGGLVTEICSCLRDAGGSSTEYQDLVRELECLQKVLTHLDRLGGNSSSPALDSIRYATLSCRRPLEQFLSKIQAYEKSLGPSTVKWSVRGQLDKIRFRLGESDEISRLQSYLSVHIGTINILLAEHGIESIALTSQKAEIKSDLIKQRLDDTQGILRCVRSTLSTQAMAVFKSFSVLERLHSTINGEVKTSLDSLRGMIMKACVSTQQIYAVLIDIRASLNSRPDVRWSFFQFPLICEDALGRKFPVPSEYDFDLLDAIIRHRFRFGPGSSEVRLGDYEILDSSNRRLALSSSDPLRPGGSLLMALLISKPPLNGYEDERCPMPQCHSTQTEQVVGGGRQCCSCRVWFAETRKKRKLLSDLWDAAQQIGELPDTDQESPRKRLKPSRHAKHEIARDEKLSAVTAYKNVRLAERALGSPDPNLPITIMPSAEQTVEARGESTFDQALCLVYHIKRVFARSVYESFLETLSLYQKGENDIVVSIERVLELFGDDGESIKKFEMFLPLGYSLERNENESGGRQWVWRFSPPTSQEDAQCSPGHSTFKQIEVLE